MSKESTAVIEKTEKNEPTVEELQAQLGAFRAREQALLQLLAASRNEIANALEHVDTRLKAAGIVMRGV